MCLIIYNPLGNIIPPAYIQSAFDHNPDGFGIMWAKNSTLYIEKGLFNIEKINNILASLSGVPTAIHFRFTTRGETSDNMAHPYQILSKKFDDEDLAMMHNGTFHFIPNDKYKSDSEIFSQHIKPIIKEIGSKSLTNHHCMEIGKLINGNKLLFMNNQGNVAIVNDHLGHWENDIWYSNDYSITKSDWFVG